MSLPPRVKTGFWARALLRRINATGRSAMVLSRGDEDRGTVLIVARTRTDDTCVLRESLDAAGATIWTREDMADALALDDYLTRQRRYDPDLWVLEIEVETLDGGLGWLGDARG